MSRQPTPNTRAELGADSPLQARQYEWPEARQPPSGTADPLMRRPSSQSQLDCRIEVLEFDARVSGGEAPIDGGFSGIAGLVPRADLGHQSGFVGDAAIQALAVQHTQLDLGHVERTPVLWRVMDLQLVGQTLGFSRLEDFVQRARRVGVEVIHHQRDQLGVGIDVIDQVFDHVGDVTTVHHLQRLLMRSWSAKCLAVGKVTQDNRGKKTAGVDGVKNLIPRQRLELAQRLTPYLKTRPVRRVWIPKPGKTEQRPLGIPTLGNRAAQTLVRLALEPEWEARFEPNSYGFRPGRSTHDAIEAIFNAIRYQPKYVLDADIAACFDRIAHFPLLNKLHTFPMLRRVIRTWLIAGVVDGGQLLATDKGAPQGSAISPLLANVALHGLETSIQRAFPLQKPGTSIRWRPLVVRYADDFVVLHESLNYVERSRDVAIRWLAEMGLELKPSKTRIVHTLRPHAGQPAGFDFLGSTVRQFPVGRTHTGKNTVGKPLGFKTIIRPSTSAQQRHLTDLADVIRHHQQSRTADLV